MHQPPPPILRALWDALTDRSKPLQARLTLWFRAAFPVLTMPATLLFVFYNRNIDPRYGITWWKLARVAWRMYRNTTKVFTGTSYRAHLMVLAKLLEVPKDEEGVVVECGCYLGGSTVNLSLAAELVGRKLVVYDSFEGLPAGDANDKIASPWGVGVFKGPIDVVRENVARYGAIEVCEFRKGYFVDTLPHHREPIVAAVLDVDLQTSIHQCLVHLWPHLVSQGYLFTDDYTILDLCAVFFDEGFWQRELGCAPPGLIGAGTGVALGQYWVGPFTNIGGNKAYPLQAPTSIAYTRKDFSGHWDFVPSDRSEGSP